VTAEDDEDEGPRPLLSAGFWAALAFGVVCIAAAGGVAGRRPWASCAGSAVGL